MKIAITGAGGMLGSALCNVLSKSEFECIPLTHNDLDITDDRIVQGVISQIKPDVLVNAAAYTLVDQAEENISDAMNVNATAVGYISKACKQNGAKLVHISTDYVFDGEKDSPYVEDDPMAPLSVYGKSKAKGEKLALEYNDKARIVRTAWLYGAGGKNFVETIIEKGKQLGAFKVVDDQLGSPTYTHDIATALLSLLPMDYHGILNIANNGYCSWYQLAVEALKLAGLDHLEVEPVRSDQFKTLAQRPKNCRLDTSRFEGLSGYKPRHWKEALAEYLAIKH